MESIVWLMHTHIMPIRLKDDTKSRGVWMIILEGCMQSYIYCACGSDPKIQFAVGSGGR